jgi:hypothetical protein
MFDLCELRLLPEYLVAIKEPKAQERIRQGDHGNSITNINLQQHHHPRQANQLPVLGSVK